MKDSYSDYEKQVSRTEAFADELKKAQAEIEEALDRIWDMSIADDGQAWHEAERFYSKHRDNWGKHKGE